MGSLRYDHVSNVQPDRQSVQGCIRLLIQDCDDRRCPGYLQGLLRPSCSNLAPHSTSQAPYPKFGDLANQDAQILTLTFAEQTNKFVRSLESRWIPESI